jgi:hypothetical protein
MESTGSHWKPIRNLLELAGQQVVAAAPAADAVRREAAGRQFAPRSLRP